MGKSCVVCKKSSSENIPNISFFQFPNDVTLKGKWLEACNLPLSAISKYTFVCSRHFRLEDIDFESRFPQKILIKGAIPYPAKQKVPTTTKSSSTLGVQPSTSFATPVTGVTFTSGSSSDKVKSLSLPRYVGDLNVSHFDSPLAIKRNLDMIKSTVAEQNKKIKTLRKQKQRAEQKIDNFKTLLEELYNQKLISDDVMQVLMDGVPEVVKDIINRSCQQKNLKYNQQIRAFALTLNFYSPKAYAYVRKVFDNLLPHPTTIRQWYSVIDGNPGFTKEAFATIASRINNGEKVIVNITMDEMSIREGVEWDGTMYHGMVDIGTGLESEDTAKCALVFMAVALNSHWKIPLGYFLINGLCGSERANLLKMCLELLFETGAECFSVTFDGASSNISMCKILGANYDPENFKPLINHPMTNSFIYTFWDPSHMIKLVRNTLGDKGIIFNSENRPIKWQYIVALNTLQLKEGLHAANKITNRHINYQNEKMKVRLAVQTLSASVSSALKFCAELNLPEFQGSEATAEFCLLMNNAFDILNSRNIFSKKTFNIPFNTKNSDFLINNIDKIIIYIKGLHNNCGKKIIETNSKTGFLGLIVCLTNLKLLFKALVLSTKMNYILTYKLSQDHLEMFFSAVRSRGGFNNNPSTVQFKSAYKRLLVRHQIGSSIYGNCSNLDDTSILFISSGKKKDTIATPQNIIDNIIVQSDHDYFNSLFNGSAYIENVLSYIGGFITRKLIKMIDCSFCVKILCENNAQNTLLINNKNRGKLYYPCPDIVRICVMAETCFRENAGFSKKNINDILVLKVLGMCSDVFSCENIINHTKEQSLFENHRITLIKSSIKIFVKLRFHYEATKKNVRNNRIRHKCTKLILFKNE